MVPSKIKRAAKIKKVNLEMRKPVKVIRKVQKNKKSFWGFERGYNNIFVKLTIAVRLINMVIMRYSIIVGLFVICIRFICSLSKIL